MDKDNFANEVLIYEEIIDYCNKAADVAKSLHGDVFNKIGHGESAESAIGAMAYFMQKETMFRYEIPNVIRGLIREKKEKGESENEPLA